MIPRKSFIRKLRNLGFRYKTQLKRTELYKRPKRRNHFSDLVYVPRSKTLDKDYVRQVFQKCGVPQDEIDSFIVEHG